MVINKVVKERHQGEYVCEAENEAGRTTTSSRLTKMESKLTWKQGIAARLQCTIKGSPELHIHWFWNERELNNGDKYKISFKSGVATVEIMNLLVTDSGRYTCEVSNNDVIPGTTVSLRTAFTGTAPLTVKWFREEKDIITGGTYFIKKDASSSSLELHSVDCTVVLFVKGAVFSIMCNFINLTSDYATDMILTINLFCLILNINLFYQNLPCL
uniref:Ig-like domain-containing protein n=1 Tax=Maylandia zebra TaxID=106582 RepID=A0A3P9CS19_9CICH